MAAPFWWLMNSSMPPRSLFGAISFDFWRFTISFEIDVWPSSEPGLEPAAPNSLDFLYTELKRASPPPPWLLVLVVFGGFVLGMAPAEAGPEVAVPPMFTLSTDSFRSIFYYCYYYILFSTSF